MHRPIDVLLTGASGNLGVHLLRSAPRDVSVLAVSRTRPVDHVHHEHCDLADPAAVDRLFTNWVPRLVIHTAYTQANAERGVTAATAHLAKACAGCGARLIHVSSDMIFDGERAPYAEDAEAEPLIPYGHAKLAAERIVADTVPEAAIIRCSLILGLAPVNPSSAWILDNLRAGKPATLFVDELRTPILAEDLAAQIWEIAGLTGAAAAGIWHLAGPEALSRYSLGLLLASLAGLPTALIQPVALASAPGPRPRDLRLSTARAERQLRHRARPLSAAMLLPDAASQASASEATPNGK